MRMRAYSWRCNVRGSGSWSYLDHFLLGHLLERSVSVVRYALEPDITDDLN